MDLSIGQAGEAEGPMSTFLTQPGSPKSPSTMQVSYMYATINNKDFSNKGGLEGRHIQRAIKDSLHNA